VYVCVYVCVAMIYTNSSTAYTCQTNSTAKVHRSSVSVCVSLSLCVSLCVCVCVVGHGPEQQGDGDDKEGAEESG
jgi:hypothetical protein